MARLFAVLRKDHAMCFEDLFHVRIRREVREAAHGNALRKPDVAARKREPDLFRNGSGVLAHHLIKVADAKKYDGFCVKLLRFQIPTIHRTDRRALFGHKIFALLFGIAHLVRRFNVLFGLFLRFRLFGEFALNDRLVRYRFFVNIVYNFDFRLLALIGFLDFFCHKLCTDVQFFDKICVFPIRIRQPVQTNVLRFRKARFTVQRIRDSFRK